MDRDILIKIIKEQKEEFEKEKTMIRREKLKKIEGYAKLPHAVIITGLRRAGKSTLLKQIKQGFYKDEEIYYFNFEDDRLFDFTVADFDMLYGAFIETIGESGVFFLDEVQNVVAWEAFVRRMYDRGFKFYITGSNSSIMSREMGTKLTGRSVELELFPFSFKEWIVSLGIEIKDIYTTPEAARIRKEFREFMEKGGIPEYRAHEEKDTLRRLYENIIYRDIIVRYGIEDENAILSIARHIMSNPASELSPTQLKRMLDIGSLNTVKNYIGYLENSYLISTINAFDYSLKKQMYSRKKVYVVDNGLRNVVAFQFSEDTGKLLENAVFVELRNRGHEIYYHKKKRECDFLVVDRGVVVQAIQVTLALDSANEKREIEGLVSAMDEYKLDSGLMLTMDTEKEIIMGKRKIIVMPVWKWILLPE